MSGDLESDRHGDGMEPPLNLFTSPPLETSLGDAQRADDSWSQDADVRGCGRLERRWILWHEFMKEHAHLDAWLRLAEQAVSSPNSAPVTYSAAKKDLRTFERLRSEAGSQLVRLDSLTHRNRTLTQLFTGAMRARLLASARECGPRWDDVNAKLETVTARLKLFIAEWEGFETEREELALWLANLDVRLTAVDHLKGNTCEKLRRLQSFQQCVCENSGRVNALLQRGELLIQRSETTDTQQIERRLLELLRHCSRVYSNIARTHTRLLSMRLVFEDDWILATDSGCPSESLLEDEGALDNSHLDVPAVLNHPRDFGQSAHPTLTFPSDLPSPIHHPPPPPPSSPTHEHLGLEWDNSVDIGRSVSCDDGDSSYFSVGTGDVKRWSFFSSRSCQSDISNDITNQEEDLRLAWQDHTHPAVFSPAATQEEEPRLSDHQWATSTPDGRDSDPLSFDGGRVRAWLGVQSPAPPERRTSCSKAVQTDEAEEESSCCEEDERSFSRRRVTSSSASSSSSPSSSPGLLFLLLAAALALLACLTWVVQDSPCHRSDRMQRSFHMALRYINGPPPT
ncbi:nesprin-2 [Hippoglossus hippoglossus]|uniref:nesprin-2 n=1 Tax=Hippoglossus hippoglossus TaxID=8267 RepID=UPI00148D54ED|nr:nesprin-2 [Hippoglossus hippoglossus]